MNTATKQKMLDVKTVGDLIDLDNEFETAQNKEMLLFVSVDNYMNNVEIHEDENGDAAICVDGNTYHTFATNKVVVRDMGSHIAYQLYLGGESLSIMPVVTIVP